MAYRFNPPPGWPQPPEGWRPPEGWQPDPSWPAAPDGWQYWVAEPSPAPDGGAGPAAGPEGAATGQQDPTTGQRPAAGQQDPAGVQAPAAPEVDGGAAASDASRPDPGPSADEPTQQFPAATPTRQMPQWGGVPQQPAAGQQTPQQPAAGQQTPQQPGMPPPGASYSAAPPPGSGPEFGGPTNSQAFQQGDPFGGGGPPAKTNRTPLIVGGIVGVVVLALLVVLGIRLLSDDDEPAEADPSPSATAPSTDPTDDPTTPTATADPTDDPSDQPTDDPTDDPSDQPTDDPTDPSGPNAGNLTALGPGELATVVGTSGEPEVEVALVSVERNWEPEGARAAMCPDPAGEYIALEFEFTTLPALADGSETYNFVGFEVGLANDNGTALEANGAAGLFCLGTDQHAPPDMGPGETHTGWAVIDAPAEASQVLWQPFLDFTGERPTYAWSLSDF